MRARPEIASVRRYLARRARFGMKFGLETMRALTAELGHPERAFPCLLIAGTNGKGSVAAYCDAVLRASGLRVGRYTSPHLVRINERITRGRPRHLATRPSPVPSARCARQPAAASERAGFEDAADVLRSRHGRGARALPPCAGRGGSARGRPRRPARRDERRSSRSPRRSSASTSTTRPTWAKRWPRSLARRRASCAAAGRPCSARCRAKRGRAIAREARELGARLRRRQAGRARGGSRAAARRRRHRERATAGCGRCQARTSATTCSSRSVCWRPPQRRGSPGSARRCRPPSRGRAGPDGSRASRGTPALLLDGAHNPAGARALAGHLRDGPPFVLVFGAMADKDVRGLARELFPLASGIV